MVVSKAVLWVLRMVVLMVATMAALKVDQLDL